MVTNWTYIRVFLEYCNTCQKRRYKQLYRKLTTNRETRSTMLKCKCGDTTTIDSEVTTKIKVKDFNKCLIKAQALHKTLEKSVQTPFDIRVMKRELKELSEEMERLRNLGISLHSWT